MYFYDALKQCNEDLLIGKFLKLCVDSPDTKRIKASLTGFLHTLLQTVPHLCSNITLRLEQDEEFADEHYGMVYAACENDPTRYRFEDSPWAVTLGCVADPASIRRHGLEYFAALVLWEMTEYGFEEDISRRNAT